jgi:putative transposase
VPEGAKTRLRWEAAKPGALWHGDVCYGPALKVGKQSLPVRIHALLDDASRYVVALQAFHNERELDMLALLVGALRRHGAPDALYLDNGATYRGDVLRVGCARLGISLLHARPYDAPARGKMERFWRTLREGCLSFVGSLGSLHDVNVRLLAWLDEHYHQAPHGGLMGKTPKQVFESASREPDDLDDKEIADALTVRVRRRVRRDTTVSVEGRDWEIDLGFLAGRIVTIGYSLIEGEATPWLEHEGKRRPLHPVDPVANSRKKRPPRRSRERQVPSKAPVDFDPAGALLDKAAHRRRNREDER